MPKCDKVIIPPEIRMQKISLELMCFLTNQVQDLQETVKSMYEDQKELQTQANIILARHHDASETYFGSFPDACGDDELDPYPFVSLPVGTKRRDLEQGAYVFILPDGTIFRVNDGDLQAVLPNGTIETLYPDEYCQVHTSDVRTFQLVEPCAEPHSEEPEQVWPEMPPKTLNCEDGQ